MMTIVGIAELIYKKLHGHTIVHERRAKGIGGVHSIGLRQLHRWPRTE